jgi:hypothetical protein
LEEADLFVILTYLDKGPTAVNITVVHEALERLVPERKERIVGWLTQPYYDKGKAEGKVEGLAEGEARGEVRGEARGKADVLTRVLEKRFGAIPDPVRHRIFSADVECIDAWADRVFDAPDLQSIFASRRAQGKTGRLD